MKIILIQVLLPLATYFIGVFIGMRYRARFGTYEEFVRFKDELVDDEEIQHVGYTAEQCGYDK